jgi:hypothetical protein
MLLQFSVLSPEIYKKKDLLGTTSNDKTIGWKGNGVQSPMKNF